MHLKIGTLSKGGSGCEKIFKFGKLDMFHPNRHKKLDELISVNYKDHMEAMKIVIGGLDC